MSETKTEGLIYKGHPLRRIDNLIYYERWLIHISS